MADYDERHAVGCPRRTGTQGRGSGCDCDTGEIGPPPTVANHDLDAIATRGMWPFETWTRITLAERDALVAVARWAQDASHHNLCRKSMYMPKEKQECTCGRDELELLKRDRGAKPPETPRDYDAKDDANDGTKACTEGRCAQVDELLSKLLTISIDK